MRFVLHPFFKDIRTFVQEHTTANIKNTEFITRNRKIRTPIVYILFRLSEIFNLREQQTVYIEPLDYDKEVYFKLEMIDNSTNSIGLQFYQYGRITWGIEYDGLKREIMVMHDERYNLLRKSKNIWSFESSNLLKQLYEFTSFLALPHTTTEKTLHHHIGGIWRINFTNKINPTNLFEYLRKQRYNIWDVFELKDGSVFLSVLGDPNPFSVVIHPQYIEFNGTVLLPVLPFIEYNKIKAKHL